MHMKCNMVHLDVKPPNIFLTARQQSVIAKLGDFGMTTATGGKIRGGTITYREAPPVSLTLIYDDQIVDPWSFLICQEHKWTES